MTFGVIFGSSITTSLTLMIRLVLFVESFLLGLVLWVTKIGALELSLIFLSLTLHIMNFRERCCTRRVLMMVLH
jgi:hypothetical protein